MCVCVCRYSIDRRTDMDRLFNVHAGNGSVFILRELDREESAWHNISVVATEFSKCSRTSRTHSHSPAASYSVRQIGFLELMLTSECFAMEVKKRFFFYFGRVLEQSLPVHPVLAGSWCLFPTLSSTQTPSILQI